MYLLSISWSSRPFSPSSAPAETPLASSPSGPTSTRPAMVQLGSLQLQSAVFNSSCPWASEIDQLRELYASPSTGAVTTRTATLAGFAQDPAVHDVRSTLSHVLSPLI